MLILCVHEIVINIFIIITYNFYQTKCVNVKICVRAR